MIYNPETEYIKRGELVDTVTNGYQYVVVHKDTLAVPIPLSKMAVYNTETNAPTGVFMSLQDVADELGNLFVPTQGFLNPDYVVIHWSFDEKKIGGLYEQDYLKQLLDGYGFQNMRDLTNDGTNDTEIKDIDYNGCLADTSKKYYLFVSAREIEYVKRYTQED